jgi:hypothetical protein
LNDQLQLWLYEKIMFFKPYRVFLGQAKKGESMMLNQPLDDYILTVYCFTATGAYEYLETADHSGRAV